MIETYQNHLQVAADTLRAGGVIAYPTEYCFGLGCDPQNIQAVQQLLDIKQRQKEQGLILIASSVAQVAIYADLSKVPDQERIISSWPGPNTWVLPVKDKVSDYLKGRHPSIAMRIPDYELCRDLCDAFGGAIVSTSANRHGQATLLTSASVATEFKEEVSYVLDAPIQYDASSATQTASSIRDAVTGEQLR